MQEVVQDLQNRFAFGRVPFVGDLLDDAPHELVVGLRGMPLGRLVEFHGVRDLDVEDEPFLHGEVGCHGGRDQAAAVTPSLLTRADPGFFLHGCGRLGSCFLRPRRHEVDLDLLRLRSPGILGWFLRLAARQEKKKESDADAKQNATHFARTHFAGRFRAEHPEWNGDTPSRLADAAD